MHQSIQDKPHPKFENRISENPSMRTWGNQNPISPNPQNPKYHTVSKVRNSQLMLIMLGRGKEGIQAW